MNLCIIPSAELSYESGSTLYANQCIKVLADRNINVYVICSKLPLRPDKRVRYIVLDILEHPVIDDYQVEDLRMWESISRIVDSIISLRREGIDIDIIHAHYATINALAALNIKIMAGIPYIVSSFGRDIFNGSSNDVRYERMVKLTLKEADYVVCSNETVKSKVLNICDKPEKVKKMGMPVDAALFLKRKQNDVDEENHIFNVYNIVSCFSKEKGIETTIKAFNILKQKKYPVILHIIGGDENPTRKNEKYYKELVKKYNLEDYIFFEGQKTNLEVAENLEKADIIVDSRYVGNYSSVVLESLSEGKAVVASCVQGNKEFIDDGENGVLYETGNEEDLAWKLCDLITVPGQIEKLERGAEKWFENNKTKYSLEDHCDKLIKIYEKVRIDRRNKKLIE